MMDAKDVRNMYSIPVVVNKHNTARVASCWSIIYYRLVMHGNSNVKFVHYIWCNANGNTIEVETLTLFRSSRVVSSF